MGDVYSIEEIEVRLRAELNAAEKALREATSEEKAQALLQFKDALHRFCLCVFTGKLEPRHS
jgi:hypothetical protein